MWGCQINPIDVNFHVQKGFDKNSSDKIWSKKDKGVESALLMPIRVKIKKKQTGKAFQKVLSSYNRTIACF